MEKHQHQSSAGGDCQSSEKLLPSQMSLEQFDEMLSHMSRKEIRHALREMARHNNNNSDDCLTRTEIYDSQAKSSKNSSKHFVTAAPATTLSEPYRTPLEPVPQPRPEYQQAQPYAEDRATPPVQAYRQAQPGDQYPPPGQDYPAPQPRFYGLNLGIVKLGVTDDGAINAGVNIGIARVDTKFGLQNRVDAQAGVGDFNAHTGAGVGLGRNGINADVYAGARVFEAAHVDAGFGAGVGPRTGVDGRLSANAGPIRFKLDTDHEVGVRGLYSGVDARVGIPRAVDFHTKAHVAVNRDSSAGADTGVELGDARLSTGAAIDTAGNTMLAPNVHIDAGQKDNYYRTALGAQLGPEADLRVGLSHARDTNNGYQRHYNSSTIGAGVGQNGIGFRGTTRYDESQYRDWAAGVGPDYE
jgi:hypothetical protein